MPIEVDIVFSNGKWHIHDSSGKCYGAFTLESDAYKAVKDPMHNFVIRPRA